MNLLPKDLFVLLKLLTLDGQQWSYNQVAYELRMSSSMVHSAVSHCASAGLFDSHQRRPIRSAVLEFAVHGVKYAFPAQPGPTTRGVPTAHSSPFFKGIVSSSKMGKYVWPYAKGTERGTGLSPLYKSVPEIALEDLSMYELLSLLDALRIGRARERRIAQDMLQRKIMQSD